MFAYCFQCSTQRCGIIARLLELQGFARAFSPTILKLQRKEGKLLELTYDLLPGYVFAYSEAPWTDWAPVCRIDGLVKRMGTEQNGYVLEGGDGAFAMQLLARNGLIGRLRVRRSANGWLVEDPLVDGKNVVIHEVDCRKQRARVDMSIAEVTVHTWVALELPPLGTGTARAAE